MSNPPHQKTRVAILSGGRSGEHDVSVRSANSVKGALKRDRYETVDFFIDRNGGWHPRPLSPEPGGNPGIDVVFPVLHGTFGEDGTVQGLLELADLPYVGSGVLGSALAMDKAMTKRVCQHAGLPVVEHLVISREAVLNDAAGLHLPFTYPVFVKPANLGSSVGISKVKDKAQLPDALKTAAEFDWTVVVERGVTGREFECAVLGGVAANASVPCEILPSEEFYNYEDKYILDKAHIELPANLSAEKTAEMQSMAVAAFHAAACYGMARVDFLMDGESGQLYVNEVNTIPGFTSISMYPKMWEYSGVSYGVLLDELIRLAFERYEQKRQTRFAL